MKPNENKDFLFYTRKPFGLCVFHFRFDSFDYFLAEFVQIQLKLIGKVRDFPKCIRSGVAKFFTGQVLNFCFHRAIFKKICAFGA